MHNFHAIEVEAEMRRQEWERAAATDARAALAASTSVAARRPKLPRVSLARPRTLPARRESITESLAPRGAWPATG